MKRLKLLISILSCWQLLIVQIAAPIITTSLLMPTYAMADETESETAEEQYNKEAEETAALEDQVTGAANTIADEASEAIFKSYKPGSKGEVINFIMVMIVGFVAASLLMCEKRAMDMYIAAAGGVIYIAAEIMQLFNSTKTFKGKEVKYTTTTTGAPDLDQTQTDAFQTQLEGYQEAQSAAENKAGTQTAAKTAWLLAAGIATTMGVLNSTNMLSCSMNYTTQQGILLAAVATATAATPFAAPALAAANLKLSTFYSACVPAMNLNVNHEATLANPSPSIYEYTQCQAVSAQNKACASIGQVVTCGFFSQFVMSSCAACSTLIATGYTSPPFLEEGSFEDQYRYSLNRYNEYNNGMQSKMPQESLAGSNVLFDVISKAATKVSHFLMPEAKAANPLVTLFGGLGVGMGLVLLLKKEMSTIVDFYAGNPYKRAITYTVMAGLASWGASENRKVAAKMGEQVSKINGILNRFDNLKLTNGTINGAFNTRRVNLMQVPLRAGIHIGTTDKPFPCIAQNKDKKCLSSKKLIETSIANSNINLPPNVTSLATNLGSTADSFSGRSRLSQGSVDGINNLAKAASAASRFNRSAQKKASDFFKKNKKKPIDFKKQGDNLIKRFQGSILKGVKKGGTTLGGAFASISPVASPDLSQSIADQLKADLAKKKAEDSSTSANAKLQGGKGLQQGKQGRFKLDLGEDENYDELNADGEKDKGELADDGTSEGSIHADDIVEDTTVSIFQVISTRYLKSGYPRVLNKKVYQRER